MADANDYAIAKAQYIKTKRVETRHRFALMADAEVARSLPKWRDQFDTEYASKQPQVLDLRHELRRLTEGSL
jgi:hypothetical protein